MTNGVRHGKRLYKQMALEVAVRNPERYESILKTFSNFEGIILDDKGILEIYAQLYIDGVVTAEKLKDKILTKEFMREWIPANCSHNNEWGYPTGYQAAFTRYLKTLSEFGFIYAQYNQKFQLSPIAKALIDKKITLSDAFAVQCMRFWRKSPYRRVLNDFNFFEFILDSIIRLNNKGHRLSYYQFMVGLFSDNGDIDDFINLLENSRIGDSEEKAYSLVLKKYNHIDEEHSKVAKKESAFRDYGNTVFRVLQLTGFITIECSGVLMLTFNSSQLDFYQALKNMKFQISDTAKESEEEYFNAIGTYDTRLENIVRSYRQKENHSTIAYNEKLPQIIKSFDLNKGLIEQLLIKVSSGDTKGRDIFWFIQEPVKFEFLLTLFVYSYYGDTFDYKPNYVCDESGIPYSHAPGNIGDIEIFNNEKYWLIEATLIRAKTQQINNETVNLFRHIDNKRCGEKFLTLVAPYIHEDTKMIINVASILKIIEDRQLILNSSSLTTEDFVSSVKQDNYFSNAKAKAIEFVLNLKDVLNEISN